MRTRAMNMRIVGLAALLATLVMLVAAVISNPIEEAQAQGTASVDFYLKIEGIDGESAVRGHEKEIVLDSWSWGESHSGSALGAGSGGGTGKVKMNDFHFTMKVSKASPKLFLAGALGNVIPAATLYATRSSDGQTFLMWELKNVIVSSYKTGGSPTSGTPTESISLNFTKIIVSYTPQNADGSAGAVVKAGYDLAKAKSI